MQPIIHQLFSSFHQSFKQNSANENLITFCKVTKIHKLELGFFIQLPLSINPKTWIDNLQSHPFFEISSINAHSFNIQLTQKALNNQDQTDSALFNFLNSWHSNFDHKSFYSKQSKEFEQSFNQAFSWCHKWMNEYLKALNTQKNIDQQAKKIDKNLVMQAIGLQQNIKMPLTNWLEEDQTWWQNISDSALAIALLSHNFENTSQALRIQFELLTCQTNLNPKVKFEQLLNNHKSNADLTKPEISRLFLTFELNCLNACTFFKPYKILYAINEFERDLQKIRGKS